MNVYGIDDDKQAEAIYDKFLKCLK